MIYFWPNCTPEFNKQQNSLGCHSVCENILLLAIFQVLINLQSLSQNLPRNSKVKARMKEGRWQCRSAAQKQRAHAVSCTYCVSVPTGDHYGKRAVICTSEKPLLPRGSGHVYQPHWGSLQCMRYRSAFRHSSLLHVQNPVQTGAEILRALWQNVLFSSTCSFQSPVKNECYV